MTQSKKIQVYLFLLVFLTVAIYLLGFNGAFIYDDHNQILLRKQLHDISQLKDVVFCGLRQIRVWQNLSIALNWSISDGQIWSFKLFNLGLHLVNGWFLFHILKKIFESRPMIPLMATALFWIHPLQTQSVTYAMGVISLIQGFFYLLPLYWLARYRLTRMPGLIFILFLSLFAKETCVLIPPILFAFDYLFLKKADERVEWKKWIPVFLVPLLIFPIHVILQDPVSMYQGTSGFDLYPFFLYLQSQLYYQVFYLVLLFAPHLQSIIHDAPVLATIEVVLSIFGGLIWIGGLWFMIMNFKRFKAASFLLLFYFITYFPTNSVFQVINPFAEYRLYLSNIPVFIGLIWVWIGFSDWIVHRFKVEWRQPLFTSIFLIYFSFFSITIVNLWNSEVNIYSHAAKIYPQNEIIHLNLGGALNREEKPNEAFDHFLFARSISGWWYNKVMGKALYSVKLMREKGDLASAWKVIEFLDRDPAKDALPEQFAQLKERVKKEMLAANLPLESLYDQIQSEGGIYTRSSRPSNRESFMGEQE